MVVNIIYCDLPHVNAVLEKCEDIDTYNLYINKNLSHDHMREEIKHELIHIRVIGQKVCVTNPNKLENL